MKSLATYTSGFLLSIAFTLVAFFAVTHSASFGLATPPAILTTILALAVVQLIVQLYFFLHLSFGSANDGSWKTAAFISTIGLVILVVIGSLWIMGHLNANMSPDQVNQYLQDQQGGF